MIGSCARGMRFLVLASTWEGTQMTEEENLKGLGFPTARAVNSENGMAMPNWFCIGGVTESGSSKTSQKPSCEIHSITFAKL